MQGPDQMCCQFRFDLEPGSPCGRIGWPPNSVDRKKSIVKGLVSLGAKVAFVLSCWLLKQPGEVDGAL